MTKKVVWITGGGKGLGSELSYTFSRNDYYVIASSSNDLSFYLENNYLNKEILSFENFEYLKCDISNLENIQSSYQYILEKYNKLDILINNAGVIVFKPFSDIDYDDFNKIMNINFKGAFYCIKTVINDMLRLSNGFICNISSTAVIENFANCSLYNASKNALLSLSRSLRNEIRSKNVKILDIILGPTSTNIWDTDTKNKYYEKMMKPQDVANIIFINIHNILNTNLHIEEIVIRPQNGNI